MMLLRLLIFISAIFSCGSSIFGSAIAAAKSENCVRLLDFADRKLDLPSELLKPSPQLTEKGKKLFLFTKEVRKVQDELIDSYKKLLTVFFEFKKAERKFNAESPITAFSYNDYLQFKEKLDSDQRLKANYFLAKLKEYGMGSANDVFQRDTTYALERLNQDGGRLDLTTLVGISELVIDVLVDSQA